MIPTLNATPRTLVGKKSKTLKKGGFLPAVVYGEGVPSQSITVPYKEFEKVYRQAGESTLVTLLIGDTSYNVLIHEVVNDPLRDVPTHADFYAVRMDKLIRTKVPVKFVGESFAVKSEGGILVKVMQEIEIEALPKDLPHEITVDISVLQTINSRLSIAKLTLPAGVKVIAHSEDIVVLVDPPRSEEEMKAEITSAAPDSPLAEVKTEKEIKAEEDAKKKEAEAAAEKE